MKLTYGKFRELLRHRSTFEQEEFAIMQTRLINPRAVNKFPGCVRRLWKLFAPKGVEQEETERTENTPK